MARRSGHGNGGRKRRYADARRRLAARYDNSPPGKASKYIQHVGTLPRGRALLVVLWCRVSARGAQKHRDNVGDQEKWLRRVAATYHLKVIKVFHAIESGQDLDGGSLAAAIAYARKHGAILLAESTDRFVRHRRYHPNANPDAQATDTQLKQLDKMADGVTLATAMDPDATPAEVRSFQRKRGQREKCNRGGRPKKNPPGYKKRHRDELWATVIGMSKRGASQREIGQMTGLARTTVQRWVGPIH